MNNSEARLLIGADPDATPAPLAEHLADCPECTQFQREMVALDGRIRRAFELGPLGALGASEGAGGESSPVDTRTSESTSAEAMAGQDTPALQTLASVSQISDARRARGAKRAGPWSGWALAASVAAASMLVVWLLRPTDSLAHDVVTHIEYESN